MLTSLERSPSTQPLFHILQRLNPEGFAKLSNYIKSKKVVDIGGGSSKEVENFVLENGGRYVNVDPHNKANAGNEDGSSRIQSSIEEYLESSENVEPEGTNFSINGLDDWSLKELSLEELGNLVMLHLRSGNFVFGSGFQTANRLFGEFRNEFVTHVNTETYFLFEKR